MCPLLTLLSFLFATFHYGKCYADVTYECPREDLGPCSCLEAYGQVFLQCSGLANRQQLTDVFRKMTGCGITELQVKDSNVTHIPRDLFENSPVSRIRVKSSMMIYLFDRELEKGAEKLTEIALDDIDFEGGLDWNVLENLVSLRTLSVTGSNVENIPFGASELELPLETLVLEGNSIESIYDLAFQNLKDLKNLKLNKNFVKRYERSMLPLPKSGLQFLDLSHNKLKSLPNDAFDGMTELHSLLLRGNHFVVLEKSYMKNVFSSLFFLDVASNPLLCSCEMAWVLSDPKPFHLFGECSGTQEKTSINRSLKDLAIEDFVECEEK